MPIFSNLCYTTKITPNRYHPRTHSIDTVTIHCYVGQVSLASALNGRLFQAGANASSNYIICTDGRLIGCCPEEDGSMCSSNYANDNRAITIEVASDSTHPYAVNEEAMNTLIELLIDICKRNNIKSLIWSKNKNKRINHKKGCNMTVHRDYAAKDCPGEYLYNLHSEIAKEVNLKLERDRLNAMTPYNVHTTTKIRRYEKLGGIVHDWTKINQKLIVSKVKFYNGELWGKGLKSGLWFRLKFTKKV